ncbi:MAG: hypothetical protein AB1760_15635 [Pseudomonadota bacterium]
MSSTLIVVIVITAVLAGAGLVAGYYITRFTRGSISLSLPATAFDEGEVIGGSFTMTTKKDLDAKRLFVALIGTEVREEHRRDSTHTHRKEIYRDEQVLEGAKTYPAGRSQEYSFQLTTPTIGDSGGGLLGTTVGNILNVSLDLLGSDHRRLEWKVEARLDAEGVDLADSQQVHLRSGSGLAF